MLSAKEKRFKRYWEEQRTGGKWRYLLLYTSCCTFIVLVAPVVGGLFLNIFSFLQLEKLPFWGLVVVIASVCFAGSYYAWERNEKKWKAIVEEEANPDPSV